MRVIIYSHLVIMCDILSGFAFPYEITTVVHGTLW